MRRLRLLLLLSALAFVALSPGALAQDAPDAPEPTPLPSPHSIAASAAILVNLDTGAVEFGREVRTKRSVASTTKVVTALVVRDWYRLDEVLTISPLAASIGGSGLEVEPGMQFSVHDMLYALLLRSGNNVAYALAEHHPGGYDHFIQLMNEKARALGAFDSSFRNPHGLDEADHYSTAWDIALFSRQLLADPVLAEIVAAPNRTIQSLDGLTQREFRNHNALLGQYPGAIGVKTGFTARAGRCLISAARTPAGTLLTVVLNTPDTYRDSRILLDYGRTLGGVSELGSGEGAIDGGTVMAADSSPTEELSPPPPAPPVLDDPSLVAAMPIEVPDYRWSAFMALVAAAMLITLQAPRRLGPLREAAQFHAYLEPLIEDPPPPPVDNRGAERGPPRRKARNPARTR